MALAGDEAFLFLRLRLLYGKLNRPREIAPKAYGSDSLLFHS